MFTFKTKQSEGKYRSFKPPIHTIKIKRKEVGVIEHETWKIRFMVIKEDINEDGNPNCEWKWIQIKNPSRNLHETKQFLKEYYPAITTQYKLYQSE
jgi:hypothetical protein